MGKINLSALQHRTRCLLERRAGRPNDNAWEDILSDFPPSQILIRRQPQHHPLVRLRTRTHTLPDGHTRTHQLDTTVPVPRPRKAKPSRQFAPLAIRYEEDELRQRFFADHPWELARPRIVVETTGDQHAQSDYTRGLKQPGVPVSGESVVQRQLALLQSVPDITVAQAYDVARREFYQVRRREDTVKRVALEEAMHNGAEPDRSVLQWSQEVENKVYNEWEEWSRSEVVAQMQRNAAFSGEIAVEGEDKALQGNQQLEEMKNQRANAGRRPALA